LQHHLLPTPSDLGHVRDSWPSHDRHKVARACLPSCYSQSAKSD
jgi:hypothetical protein